ATARSDHRHRRASRGGLPLLHRLVTLGSVVGRGLDDRRPPRRPRPGALPRRRRGRAAGVVGRSPGGVEPGGEAVKVGAPPRIVFSYGYVSGKPIPPGSSLVTIRLEPGGPGPRPQPLPQFAHSAVPHA